MTKIYTILIALIFAISLLPASIADYYLAPVASVGTYAPVVGGLSGGTEADGWISPALPIGFTFSYCGADYTTFKMVSDGYINVGENLTTYNLTNNLASTTTKPIIAPLWDDLNPPVGSMVYLTTGDAPNRVLTVQWTNIKWDYGGNAGQNFQVKLFETTNQIKLVYGTMITARIPSASIGINSGAGGTGNFFSITPGSPMTYSVSTSNNTIGNSSLPFLTSGTTYTFNAAAQNTVPTPAFYVSPIDGGTGIVSNATLNWISGGGAPTDYDVYFGTNPIPDYVGNFTATTYNPGPLAYNTTYYWQIMPENAFGFAENCPIWSFTTQIPVTTYPFTEGFEAVWTGNAPPNWSQINVSGTKTWLRYTTGAHSGTGLARILFESTGGSSLLITPPLNFGTNNYNLKFWMKGGTTVGTDLKVQIASNGTSATNFTDLAYYPSASIPTVWTQYTIDLSAYEGMKFIAFRDIDLNGSNVCIDDVLVELIPPQAPNPVTLVAPAAGASNVSTLPTVSWTPAGTGPVATDYYVYCDTNAAPTTLIGSPTASPLTFTTPLAYSTTYYWKVVAHNADGFSTGNTIQSFTTMALPSPAVTMTLNAGLPVLNWNPVTGAHSYYIYREQTPFGVFAIGNQMDQVSDITTSYPLDGDDPMLFYKVRASTDVMP